ncbi:MAG: YdgA family protein [Succinivibrionaceae bacterium]|nr:YdgA family protein [Succinivibrionaceae bacterium]
MNKLPLAVGGLAVLLGAAYLGGIKYTASQIEPSLQKSFSGLNDQVKKMAATDESLKGLSVTYEAREKGFSTEDGVLLLRNGDKQQEIKIHSEAGLGSVEMVPDLSVLNQPNKQFKSADLKSAINVNVLSGEFKGRLGGKLLYQDGYVSGFPEVMSRGDKGLAKAPVQDALGLEIEAKGNNNGGKVDVELELTGIRSEAASIGKVEVKSTGLTQADQKTVESFDIDIGMDDINLVEADSFLDELDLSLRTGESKGDGVPLIFGVSLEDKGQAQSLRSKGTIGEMKREMLSNVSPDTPFEKYWANDQVSLQLDQLDVVLNLKDAGGMIKDLGLKLTSSGSGTLNFAHEDQSKGAFKAHLSDLSKSAQDAIAMFGLAQYLKQSGDGYDCDIAIEGLQVKINGQPLD